MKHRFNLATVFGIIAIVALLCCIITPAVFAEGWPAVKTLTLPGGGAGTNIVSDTYSAGVGQSVYTSFKPVAIEVVLGTAPDATGSITFRRGTAAGPVYHTIATASGTVSYVSFVTNDFYIVRDDTWYAVAATTTNAGTIRIIGTEM